MKYLLIAIFNLIFLITNAQVITKEFEEFKKNQNLEFKDFKDKRDQEFSNLLKNKWKTFESLKGNTPPIVPKPPKQPDSLPSAPIQLDSNNLKRIVILDTHKIVIDSSVSTYKIDSLEKLSSVLKFKFYSKNISIKYDTKLISHLTAINEKGISDYWVSISKSEYELFLTQLTQVSKELKLNDWGKFDLIDKISMQLFENKNDQALFMFFILNHWGMEAKVGKINNEVALLIPFQNIIYKKSFLLLNKNKYYIMNDVPDGLIQTFEQRFSNTNKILDLKLSNSPNLGADYTTNNLIFKKYNRSIEINFNKSLIAFNKHYPLTDLNIFFSAKVDPITENNLIKSLYPLLKDKNELEAVNILLDFVENSFEYKTDFDQFGYEKFYFPEDILFYPYSDCEDRAIFFSYLVKTLLKLDVVGLDYKTHVATAIKFNSNINGDYVLINNERYIICDPTYIGASAGMCMPQFKTVNPEIITPD
jgi:hypothetical protein